MYTIHLCYHKPGNNIKTMKEVFYANIIECYEEMSDV